MKILRQSYIRKITGDKDSNKEGIKNKIIIPNMRKVLLYIQAFQMFKDDKSLADVAIKLCLKTGTILNFHGIFIQLSRIRTCKNF